jgi:sugar lactone lactonase YvrE
MWLLGLMMCCANPARAQIQFIGAQSTVPATGLNAPFATAVDSLGDLYIADAANNRVVKIDIHGTQTVVSVSPLTLSDPTGVALDSAGNLYISDTSNGRVVKVPASGGAAAAFASVVTPGGLAVDASGNVFVADSEDAKVVKITSGGVKSDFETGLGDPIAVGVDAAGNVYLADSLLTTIVKYAPGGGAGSNVGSSLGGINGVAVDGAGNVYVSESGEGAVIIQITPGGAQITLAVSGLGSADYLAVDANYNLYIPDATNNAVIEFSTKTVNFGFANVCQSGAPAPCSRTATLQFALGEDAISAISLVTTGDQGFDFSQSGGSCEGETSPCTIEVTFQPTQPGMRSGGVMILDAALGQTTTYPVYGFGNGADAGFTPALTSPPFGTDGFQDPIAVAVAGAGIFEGGPIFIADDGACVIWIAGEGNDFEIYAGTYGTCGYGGDGGAATSAQLGNPGDLALDGAGNLYIADTANNIVRMVDRNGNISTVAGNVDSPAGFSGDHGAATIAQLNAPTGVALDNAGNLYIADENNSRIRKVDLAGIITTVAGSNQSGYSGDGGLATSAKLHRPLGVRADGAGNLFIADSFSNVVRKVNPAGIITTVAGNFGMGSGYSGDGGPATSAQLNFPVFVSVDAAGQLFITDANNSVIRRVDGAGKITTYVVPTDSPSDFVIDPTGNVAMIDPVDEALTLQVRTIPLGNDFGSQNVNTPTAAQDVTVTNIGNQPLIFSAITPPTGFNLGGPDTSCSSGSPLSIGIDCILGIVFDPPTAGGFEDAVAVTDNSLGPAASSTQNIGVTGTGVVPLSPTTTALGAAPTTAIAGQTVTLTATVTPNPSAPAGSVDFCLGGIGPGVVRSAQPVQRKRLRSLRQWSANAAAAQEVSSCNGGTLLGTVSVGANGIAILTITNLPVGTNNITAVYSGNATLDVSTSDAVTVTINPAATTTTTIGISPNPGFDGQSVTLTGTVAPTPTSTPPGSITFCDSGSVGPTVRRVSDPAGIMARQSFGSAIRRDGGGSPCGADAVLGTVNVAQGVATLMLTTLTVGDHNIYAVYTGAVGFSGSASDPLDEPVEAAYTVAAPQTPFDVTEGGSVQITVTVPPLGGAFNSVVTLVASGLPPGATATFNPPTVTPGVAGAQTVMTIQLAASGASRKAALPTAPIALSRTWPLPLAAMGILVIAVGLRRRSWSRFAAAMSAIAVISVAAITLTGCNGGFAGSSTPKGQYIVTVTGTSGSLHPSTTVTVVVQ